MCNLSRSTWKTQRPLELLQLFIDPRLTGPVGLVLIADEHVAAEHLPPDLSDFGFENVVHAGPLGLQSRVWIEEHDTRLPITPSPYGFHNFPYVPVPVIKCVGHHLDSRSVGERHNVAYISEVLNHSL